jgi:hypothetical protein
VEKFWAECGGRKILSRVEMASDRRKAPLFHLENLAANARVAVRLVGNGLKGINGQDSYADGDGQTGETNVFTFDTLASAPVGSTAGDDPYWIGQAVAVATSSTETEIVTIGGGPNAGNPSDYIHCVSGIPLVATSGSRWRSAATIVRPTPPPRPTPA